jgi:ribosomal protein S18 acetylase RimI-like enzyme
LEPDYYLRDLTAEDWSKFSEMDKLIFPDEQTSESGFMRGLSGLKSLSVIAVHKESKDFIGYYKIGVYGNEGHVMRIGVHPEHRRKGLGTHLLERSMFQLKNAGCKSYYLYVMKDNEAAIELYKKQGYETDKISWQFKFPYKKLNNSPKGKIRHVEWGEIQMICLRFNLNPVQIQQYFGRENQHVLVFEVMGQQLGFTRFSPDFPGGMPFILKDPSYVIDFVSHLKTFVTNPDFDAIKTTFDNQENLVAHLQKEKIPLNYELLKMRRAADE